jgi:ubiquinone/menaquinone biosynthesis C-methylase UbiE
MNADKKPKTGHVQGRWWGARARDWAQLQEPQCRPLFERVLERAGVGPATRYLDAGCGAGLAAQIAARRGAQVAGIDAAPNLLAVARERVADGDFREGDIEALPFDDDAFDVVTGFNAFQYAGNPDVALVEARRVARPGGIVVVVTWGKPEGMPAASLVMALRPLLPPPPPGAPGPFALSDEPTLRAFAARAGLGAFEMIDVHSPWHYPDLATALRALGSSGVAARAIEQSGEEALDRAHREALAPFRQPDASYRVEATFRCLFARA